MENFENLAARNTGISLFKLFMAFIVVTCHFLPDGTTFAQKVLSPFRPCAVPCFMFLTFFLAKDLFANQDKIGFIKRIKRLYIPIVLWSVFYYVFYSITRYFIGRGMLNPIILFRSLILAHASELNPPMWYLIDAIFSFVFIFFAFYIAETRRARIVLLTVTFTLCFLLQYTGTNAYFFENAAYESKYPIGRFAEVLPYAILWICYYAIKDRLLTWHKICVFGVSAILCFVLQKFGIEVKGFGYQGFERFFLTLCCILFFMSLPQIKIKGIAFFVNYLAQFTMGVFCMHMLIGKLFNIFSSRFDVAFFQGTLFFDLIIYFICIVFSIIGGLIGKKIKILRGMFV